MIIKTLISIAVIIIGYFAIISFLTRHDVIKVESQRQLDPCPNKPNCILSTSTIKRESIESFSFLNHDSKQSWQALNNAVVQDGGHIIINDGTYLHAIFTSTIFRFKDDFEALLTENHIDIRSASRAGKSDLGQNRKRIERIRSLYQQH